MTAPIPTKAAFSVLTANEWNAVAQRSNDGTSVQTIGSFSPSSSIGTGGGAVLTLTGCVLKSGYAYDVILIGGVGGSTANEADFGLHKNAIGTQIGAFYRTPTPGAAQRNATGFMIIRRTALTDLTLDLIVSVTASTGTVAHDAASVRPRSLVVRPCGAASDYPYAYDVP
jgi:hypothetical protein